MSLGSWVGVSVPTLPLRKEGERNYRSRFLIIFSTSSIFSRMESSSILRVDAEVGVEVSWGELKEVL